MSRKYFDSGVHVWGWGGEGNGNGRELTPENKLDFPTLRIIGGSLCDK